MQRPPYYAPPVHVVVGVTKPETVEAEWGSGTDLAGSGTEIDGAIRARTSKNTQAIAHRGFKAQYPENSMAAFQGAVRVGAHAIETGEFCVGLGDVSWLVGAD